MTRTFTTASRAASPSGPSPSAPRGRPGAWRAGRDACPARMATARRAAFVAPGLPMARVPTGMPAGICTVERSESSPLSEALSIGTPSTGRSVCAATTPARCAAPPAAAISTSMPRASAAPTYSTVAPGVRCAESTRHSCATPKRASVSLAFFMVSQSDLLPMRMPTRGLSSAIASAPRLARHRPAAGGPRRARGRLPRRAQRLRHESLLDLRVEARLRLAQPLQELGRLAEGERARARGRSPRRCGCRRSGRCAAGRRRPRTAGPRRGSCSAPRSAPTTPARRPRRRRRPWWYRYHRTSVA